MLPGPGGLSRQTASSLQSPMEGIFSLFHWFSLIAYDPQDTQLLLPFVFFSRQAHTASLCWAGYVHGGKDKAMSLLRETDTGWAGGGLGGCGFRCVLGSPPASASLVGRRGLGTPLRPLQASSLGCGSSASDAGAALRAARACEGFW